MRHMKKNKTLFNKDAQNYIKKLQKVETLTFKSGIEEYTYNILMSDGTAYTVDSNFEDEITEITRFL